MKQIHLDYPDDLATAIQLTSEEMRAQILLMAALKMLELGKLSSGKAAELAGLSRVEFLNACGRYGVSTYNYAADEVEAELKSDLQTLQDSLS